MTRAVLFDLDGTLTPRRASVERFASLFQSDFALRLEPVALEQLTDAIVELDQGGYNPRRAEQLRSQLRWSDPPAVDELETHWQMRFPDAVIAMPGLEPVLSQLASEGVRMGIVTNGPVAGQNAKVDRLGARGFMQSVIVSEGAGLEKPDPRIFQLACDELDVRADDCWFVGDHPVNDVIGARRCGMTAVWITNDVDGHAWPEDEEAACHRIESLGELPALLEDAS